MSPFLITLEKSLERGCLAGSHVNLGPLLGTQLGPVAVSDIGEVGKSPGQHFFLAGEWASQAVKKKKR